MDTVSSTTLKRIASIFNTCDPAMHHVALQDLRDALLQEHVNGEQNAEQCSYDLGYVNDVLNPFESENPERILEYIDKHQWLVAWSYSEKGSDWFSTAWTLLMHEVNDTGTPSSGNSMDDPTSLIHSWIKIVGGPTSKKQEANVKVNPFLSTFYNIHQKKFTAQQYMHCLEDIAELAFHEHVNSKLRLRLQHEMSNGKAWENITDKTLHIFTALKEKSHIDGTALQQWLVHLHDHHSLACKATAYRKVKYHDNANAFWSLQHEKGIDVLEYWLPWDNECNTFLRHSVGKLQGEPSRLWKAYTRLIQQFESKRQIRLFIKSSQTEDDDLNTLRNIVMHVQSELVNYPHLHTELINLHQREGYRSALEPRMLSYLQSRMNDRECALRLFGDARLCRSVVDQWFSSLRLETDTFDKNCTADDIAQLLAIVGLFNLAEEEKEGFFSYLKTHRLVEKRSLEESLTMWYDQHQRRASILPAVDWI